MRRRKGARQSPCLPRRDTLVNCYISKKVLDGALRYGERPLGRLEKPLLERVVEDEEGFSKQTGNGQERRKVRLGSCIPPFLPSCRHY